MEVVSMLKSKDAFVPCRNLSLGNRLSLTAMEKAAAFPLWAGFMPNSPMPMLDVCDWLLLPTISTTGGGWLALFLCCWLSLLLPPARFLASLPRRFSSVIITWLGLVMVVGVEKLCCVVCCVGAGPEEVLLFWISILSYVLCTIVRIIFLARAGWTAFEWPPRMTYRRANTTRSDAHITHAVFTKNCGCCQQPMRTAAISPLLLSSSPKWLEHHLCW